MPNKLIHEFSPYLLQHATNPVDWYPYGSEALLEAKKRNCPVIISIGYSACHWCHVMAHESFSVPEIAEVMNKHFVCIKVDREERPDLDQIYLNAVQILHGQGGWPLNCFALPDGRPFWGGTYFRPDQWKDVLLQIAEMYKNNYNEISDQAERIHQGLLQHDTIKVSINKDQNFNTVIEEVHALLIKKFDYKMGGTIGAPKFPMPSLWQFMLSYFNLTHSENAITQLRLTLEKMAMGGIFDQIGGGFARYSTDSEWKVPHFEKMLYDNAQLAMLYANTYKATNDPLYFTILSRILEFIKEELTSSEGAFYSALDADSDGVEGKFYVWTKSEILYLFPEYGELLCRYWGVGNQGHWEHGINILLRPYTDDHFARVEHLSVEELKQLISMASRVMYKKRKQRSHPNLDDKIITSWNALTIKAYAIAATAVLSDYWRETALKASAFLVNNLISPDGQIKRSWKNGFARINGFLNDYAYTISAFLSLYQMTFDEKWLFRAKQLTDYVIEHFAHDQSPLFWYLPIDNEESTILALSRIMETTDGVEPSGNSVMAENLLFLGNYFEQVSYIERSIKMCNIVKDNVIAYPVYHANWASVITAHSHGITLIAIAGQEALDISRQLTSRYDPFTLIAAASNKSELPIFEGKFKESHTLIYKCKNNTCDAPVEKIEELS